VQCSVTMQEGGQQGKKKPEGDRLSKTVRLDAFTETEREEKGEKGGV